MRAVNPEILRSAAQTARFGLTLVPARAVKIHMRAHPGDGAGQPFAQFHLGAQPRTQRALELSASKRTTSLFSGAGVLHPPRRAPGA